MRPFITFIFISFWFSLTANAQSGTNVSTHHGLYLLETMVIDGDTVPVVTLRTAYISSSRMARSKRYQREYDKLERNVIKAYPYAQLAGRLIKAYNENLALLDTEAAQKEYLNRCEDDLKAEFEGDLRKMTRSQGLVLIKLIDRETGNTSYELIKTFRSGFTAFMWQGVAKMFGSDLKTNYDPGADDTDYMIEEIVSRIESGHIEVALRDVKTPAARDILDSSDKRLQKKIERQRKKQAGKVNS